jgi:predicted transposase YdaD
VRGPAFKSQYLQKERGREGKREEGREGGRKEGRKEERNKKLSFCSCLPPAGPIFT